MDRDQDPYLYVNVSDRCWPINTGAEEKAARDHMVARGLTATPILVGHPDGEHYCSRRLFRVEI